MTRYNRLRWYCNGSVAKRPGKTDLNLGAGGFGSRTWREAQTPGSYEPSAATTGLLPGTVLTTYTGPTTITTAGTVIQNKEIFASLDIRAANVTIDNCKIRATSGASYVVTANNVAASNVVLTHCEVFPDVPSHNYNGIQGHDLTVKWCNIHDSVDGINLIPASAGAALSCYLSMNWIHDLSYWSPDTNHTTDNQSHNDGIQLQGGAGPVLIQGNMIDSRGYSSASGSGNAPDRGTGTSANGRYAQGALTCIQFTDAPTNVYTASTSGALVQVLDNFLYGGYRSLAAGSAENYDIGRWWRNKFDDAQGLRAGGSLAAHQGYTAVMDALTTCDTGDGTVNANVYMDGGEITVRRNQ